MLSEEFHSQRSLFGLLICHAIIAVSILFFAMVKEKTEKVLTARKEYQVSLSRTKVQLAGLLHTLAREPSFRAHVQLRRKHSLHRFLSGFLRQGEIDSLAILESNGNTILRVNLALGADAIERKGGNSTPDSSFFWFKGEEGPILGLSMPLENGEWVRGLVQLDQHWWQLHPGLNRWRRELGLAFVDKPDPLGLSVIMEDGYQGGHYVVTLASERWMPLGVTFLKKLQSLECVTLLLFIGMLSIGSIWKFLQRGRSWRKQLESQEIFLTWLKGMFSLEARAMPHSGKIDYEFLKEQIRLSKINLAKSMRMKDNEIKKLKEEINSKESTCLAAEKVTREIDFYRMEQIQVQQLYQKLLHSLAVMDEKSHTVSDILRLGVLKSSNHLFQVITLWQASLKTVSPRKFFRSLSERQSSQQGNELERHLSEIFDSSKSNSNAAIALSMQINQLVKGIDRCRSLMVFLRSCGNHSENFTDIPLQAKLCADTLKIIYPNLECEMQASHHDSLIRAKLPSWVGKTIIFGVINLIAKEFGLKSASLSIVGEIRPKGNEIFLVMYFREREEFHPSVFDQFLAKINQLSRLARSYGGSIVFLPFFQNEISITIAFPALLEAEQSHEENKTAHTSQSHPQSHY